MTVSLYISLSIMMLLQYAIWGAWAPVLASRLLGPLKFNGKQTGWIYGTLFLAFIVSPLIAGQVVDKWVATERVLAVMHILGGVFLFVAAKKAKFGSLFVAMCLYSLCYAATVPLANSLMFTQLGKVLADTAEVNAASAKIFIWPCIGWVLAGLLLTGWRRIKGTGDGSDCLKMAAGMSILMGIFCFFLPNTPPPGASAEVFPFLQAFSLLNDTNFLIFLVLSLIVGSQLQFYYLGTAHYLDDIGVQTKNIPAVMSIAQVAQLVVTMLALGYFVNTLGFRWTLAVGAASWLLMYLFYAAMKPKGLVIGSMALHGAAYVLFIIGGQIYVNTVAPDNIKASARALLFVVIMGFGLFAGTQFTGIVMDRFKKDDKFQWRPIFLVPCALIFVCAICFVLFFRG